MHPSLSVRGLAVVAAVAVLTLAAAIAFTGRGPATIGGERGRGGANPEATEQIESTAERLEALHDAREEGRFGTRESIVNRPATGWTGEQLVNAGTDDWEPAIAADPSDPWVYVVVTRYGQPKPCPGNCPTPYMALEISSDGGRTWSNPKPLCACKGSGQFDPIIEVVPNTGVVYAVYMNGYNVVFIKSADHGRTWTDPVPTYGKVSWNDKPVMTTSANGRDVYVSWNGPNGGDAWITVSHDFGVTWTQRRVTDSARYFFAYDATALPNGTVVFSESSLDYANGDAVEAVIKHHAFVSTDRGRTWHNVVVDTVSVGVACVDCRADFYLGHTSVSSDEDGDLVYVYDGATTDHGPQRIWVKRSTDAGSTWSGRVPVSTLGENATSPTVEMVGDGDARLWFMETAGADPDVWNVWYRSSSDGGATWSARSKLSDATSGADYKIADGFMEPYGDYGEIAVTSAGKTVAVWGEGFSWAGPGGVWLNRQR